MDSSISYYKIKDFIYKKLQDIEGILPQNKIEEEINNTKKLIDKLGLETFAVILSTDAISCLEDDDWLQMKRELETHFDVQMENGVLIQGEQQQLRDNTWWTGKEKQENQLYYWSRYKEYLKKSFPPEVIKTIDKDTDIIMDNIEEPLVNEFSRYGMVVGHVQSGKTANYSGLVCKAADSGYKFIVIIAGGINNLRNQTQIRLNESFVGLDKGIPVGVGKFGNLKKELLPISLTTAEQDFNKQDANKNAQGLNFDNISSPILIVIKKNSSTLDNVLEWLQKQYKNGISSHAMLLIDDESDYASINTKNEEDPTSINKKIRKLLSLFQKSAYIAFTATPYANIFIDHEATNEDFGRDLFPKDFIYALEAPSNYFGARKIFIESNKKYLVPINDYKKVIPEKHKKDFPLPLIPESLYDAIRVFIINIGIRLLRKNENNHNSMLIHATRFTLVHQRISMHVENYVSDIKKEITTYGRLENAENYSNIIRDIKHTYHLHFPYLEYDWSSLLHSCCNIIDSIVIREVHQSTSVPLEYRKDRFTNAIVIGGTSLSRGFTLEGLSVSYFLRNTIFYDTLMQMGRWFGYREGYEDLCRIYMTETMIENFALIIQATEDLIDTFKRMSEAKMTPNDFGLAVQFHPDSGLQVTARNKQKNSKEIYFTMKLDGHAKETSWLYKDEEIRNNNLQAIEDIVSKISLRTNVTHDIIGNHHLWRDVDKKTIFEFINIFKTYSSDPFGIRSRMPIEFVKKYITDINTDWDVALYSGFSKEKYNINGIEINKEKRKLEGLDAEKDYFEILNRQVSSGTAEAIVLPENQRKRFGSDRKSIREIMDKPLLMLHILDTDEDKQLAAFGISFPGGISSTDKTIKIMINSVYIQNLLNEEEYDD